MYFIGRKASKPKTLCVSVSCGCCRARRRVRCRIGAEALHPLPFRQEAAAQAVGGFAEAQVDAGGLDARHRDPVPLGGDDALVDGPLQPLARQDAPEARREIERCGHRGVSSHGAQYGRQPIRSARSSRRRQPKTPAYATFWAFASPPAAQTRRYPDPGGDWGLVALLVFKTSAPARVGGRVRFPSASANRV